MCGACSAYKNAIDWGKSFGKELVKAKPLGYLLGFSIALSLAAGMLLFLVDPNVKSPVDGVWSAWVTMTHVGFGDIVPVSLLGRLVAGLLILAGLIVLSLCTALVSVTMIGRNMEALGLEMKRREREISGIETGESRILQELIGLRERIDQLEQRLAASGPPRQEQAD